jgi:GxxExxY protein
MKYEISCQSALSNLLSADYADYADSWKKGVIMTILFEALTREIIGAAFEVHRTLGCGFLEAVYQEAMELELQSHGILFVSQQNLEIEYKGQLLKQKYRPDFLVDNKVIVEIKALACLAGAEEAQVLNYLKASG